MTSKRLFSLSEDHPRTCGEHLHKANPDDKEAGSPPHLRGTHNAIFLIIG